MALEPKPDDLRLQKRRLLVALLTTPLLAALVGFISLQAKAPQWPGGLVEPVQRGSILASDGTILAEGSVEHRRYPQGRLASHIVGFTGKPQPEGNYGLEGLEYTLDERLQQGFDVTITIDPALQAVAEAELRRAIIDHQAENGVFIMLERRTGRILASASYPDFDPNEGPSARNSARINRAFLQQVEPGSTMKPFVVAALLEEGRLQPNELVATEQTIRVGDQTFRDVTSHEGLLDPTRILRHSSNVGMIKIGQRFSPQELYGWFDRFGFGRSPSLRHAYTRSGQINDWTDWVPQDHASVSIGQSLSVTGLQLTAAYNTLANNGVYVAPRLVEDDVWDFEQQVISSDVAALVRDMLVYTVEESSLRRAKIPGVQVAGKSGTADIFDRASGRYIKGDYTMSFAGFFPADDPRVTAVVYLQKPQIGTLSSLVATPIFRAVGSETVALWGMPTGSSQYATY